MDIKYDLNFEGDSIVIDEYTYEPIETGTTVSDNGTTRHYAKFPGMINSVPHCEDGPAVIYENGTKEWWVNGLLHRDGAPAIEYEGDAYFKGEEWYQYGVMHRVDGPALVNQFKTEWWYNGNLHRVDGPAVVRSFKLAKGAYYINNKKWLDPDLSLGPLDVDFTSGPKYFMAKVNTGGIAEKEWWVHGKLHRWDGPAIEYFPEDVYFINGPREEYWIDGYQIERLKQVLEDCQIEGDQTTWSDGEFMILRLALSEDLAIAKRMHRR